MLKNERFPQLFLEFGLLTKTTDDVIAILKNLYAVFIEIWRLKKLANWEWSYSKPDAA